MPVLRTRGLDLIGFGVTYLMKFQIVTYRRTKRWPPYSAKDTYIAACRAFHWSNSEPYRTEGKTPEEAREKMVKIIQEVLDKEFSDLRMTEVDLEPREDPSLGTI